MSHVLNDSPNARINKTILKKYLDLPMPEGVCQAMYVWYDDYGLRCKTRTLDFIPEKPEDCPVWICDGSYYYFKTQGEESDSYLTPVAMYRDPFHPGNNKLILCGNYKRNLVPTDANKRHECVKAMEAAKQFEPWFGIEQEYFFIDSDSRPLGWPKHGFPKSQNHPYPYNCGVGASRVIGREVTEAHYRACMYAGIQIGGTNSENGYGQWEFQIGTSEGIKVADDLWMARFILYRITEEYGIDVTLDPKPIEGDWDSCGAHCNFSTKAMREKGGLCEIQKACEKLRKTHSLHMKVYGEGNERRLNGQGDTSTMETFSSGIGNRSCSIRIPRAVANEGKGYLEDRRPASNSDPYLVCERLVRTLCLDEM